MKVQETLFTYIPENKKPLMIYCHIISYFYTSKELNGTPVKSTVTLCQGHHPHTPKHPKIRWIYILVEPIYHIPGYQQGHNGWNLKKKNNNNKCVEGHDLLYLEKKKVPTNNLGYCHYQGNHHHNWILAKLQD